MDMLKIVLSISLSIFIAASCLSQGEKPLQEKLSKKNAVYLELLGQGLFYSVNYDRILLVGNKLALSGRVGLSYYPITSFFDAHTIAIPIEFNLLVGNGLTYFEFGLGGTYMQGLDKPNFSKSFFASLRLGYRYQKDEGGLMFRIGFTPLLPIILDDEYQLDTDYIPLLPSVGLSVGYTF